MFRKIIAILLLILFTYNIFGFYYCFVYKQNRVRSEVKTQIKNKVPQEHLILFKFTKKQISQLSFTKENEFQLNGKMYDIVKSEYKKDITLFYCINDEQEEKLFENLDEQVSNNLSNPLQKNNSKNTSLKIIKDYLAEHYAVYTSNFVVIKHHFLFSEKFNSRFISPFSPPPKI